MNMRSVHAAKPIRILVVDDNAAALYATARVLRSAKYEVITATTGTAALEAAIDADLDLIVLDINLPDVDGFEVCRRLRAIPRTAPIPVLHLSATFTEAADLAVGLDAGADGYLTRPVEPPILLATVRTLLFARRADALRMSLDARLRTMFELSPSGMAVLDVELNYENVNPAYCALVGCSADELVGRPLADTPGEGWNHLSENLSAQRQAAGRWQAVAQLKRRDGGVRYVDWRAVYQPLSGTHFITATDVTAQRQHESEREQLLSSERIARSEAERASRMKEEFLATLSHELRNPLNAILGWANVLTLRKDLPPAIATAVEAIQRNGKLQATMIGDLLDYAGINFGKLRLVLAPVDPYAAVRAALQVMQPLAGEKGIDFQCSFGLEPLTVHADPDRLQQIVWNLLSNAIKFSTEGGTVFISASKHDNQFRLSIKDQGKGISPAFLPRIFERFSQADASSTRHHAGLGIGMAIVKQLVEAHGASIEALSEGEGKGAEFVLQIPLADALEAPSTSDSQRLRLPNLSGAVILLVEDDRDTRTFIARLLADAGAVVIESADAQSALAHVEGGGVDLLISDIGMPDVDGYELLRQLRRRGHESSALPAIALTAFARMEDHERALAAGFQDHLTKPIEPQNLLVRLDRILDKHVRSNGATGRAFANARAQADATSTPVSSDPQRSRP
jgi:hypothetical protein